MSVRTAPLDIVMVPVEPTEAMLLALAAAPKWSWSALTVESARERYRAMLSAAPSAVSASPATELDPVKLATAHRNAHPDADMGIFAGYGEHDEDASPAPEPERKEASSPLRAALRAYATVSKYLPCPICNSVEGCDHTVLERLRADALAAIEAAPPAMLSAEREE